MIQHTIILESRKFPIPKTKIVEFVTEMLFKRYLVIDYMGVEIDNQADYADKESHRKIQETTFISIHFEYEIEIDFSNMSNDLKINFVILLLTRSEVFEIKTDEKDITIILMLSDINYNQP